MLALETLDGRLFGPDQPCFGCSPTHPHGFRLRYERDSEGVVTTFTPASTHQGPPGIMHGGLVSTVADETAAWALIAATGKFGFTASFDMRLKRVVRVGQITHARGKVTKPGSRVVRLAVEIAQGDAVCATGDFTFMLMDQHSAEAMLGGPLPEAWIRFCR
jgi:acyl-coenzyme A thioesterase PaaI-like protein